MKRYYVLIAVAMTSILLSYCHSSKKAMTTVAKTTYENNLQTVIAANCTPCHIPSKGGNKTPYDNYAAVSKYIDEMIRRIELNPADRGFMPFKKPTKLSDSTIAVFKQWKADGMLEK
jgi:uncharacterized membrane protein